MTARRDLADSVFEAERELDRMFAALAPALRRSVERRAEGGAITDDARRGILRDVDAILDVIYPVHRGAPSRIEEMVVRHSNAARFKPVVAAVTDIRARLTDEPLVLHRIERG